VTLGGGLELPLERIGDTDLWTVTVAVANIDQAVISYWFVPTRDGQTPEGRFIARVWRGPAVPEQAFVTTIFEGSVQVQTVASAALGENRIVSVYVPPSYDPDSEYPVIYMADGGMTRDLAAVIDVPIQQGTLPPVLLVGVHLPEESAEDWRSAEYLPGVDPERFAAHEQFFTEELPDFLTEYFAATTDRERVAVLGIEEGASFALAMIGAHSDRYGIAMPFALGTDEGLDEIDWDPLEPSRFYLVSGAFNAQSSALTRAWSERLTDSGHEVARQERVGGNDLVIWQEEFVNAIRWAFSDGQRGFSQADE
jgi:enterochelin esterase-like enzyme